MKNKILCLAIGLGLVLFTFSSCTREAIEEPSPTGPSTVYLTLTLSANPNLLYATSERPTSEIKAVAKEGNIPLAGALIIFTIQGGPGYFSDYSQRIALTTDGGGAATLLYIGPTNEEITYDQDAYIRAQLQTKSPQYMHKEVYIHILRAED